MLWATSHGSDAPRAHSGSRAPERGLQDFSVLTLLFVYVVYMYVFGLFL